MNEHAHNSTYIDIYNKKIKDVPIIPCFCCERILFLKQLKKNSNIIIEQVLVHFEIQIEPSSTTYICSSCLHNQQK